MSLRENVAEMLHDTKSIYKPETKTKRFNYYNETAYLGILIFMKATRLLTSGMWQDEPREFSN